MKRKELIDFTWSLVPLLVLVFCALFFVITFGLTIISALIVAIIVAAAVAIFHFNFTYNEVMMQMSKGISNVVPAVLILLTIGLLASSFMYSGIVPALAYYSAILINQAIFLPVVMLVTAIISSAIGSSFTSIATIGVAFFTTGLTLGYNEALLIGAIVSGAMFGDKLSPLSDTTNIAAMMANANLFKHIKNMLSDTLIAFILAFIIFMILGFQHHTGALEVTDSLESVITSNFNISFILVLLPLLLIVFTILKLPTLVSMLLMCLIAIVIAVFYQGFSLSEVLLGMTTSTNIVDSDALFASLFNRGGISTMYNTIIIIFLSTSFGSILRFSKMFDHLIVPIENIVKSAKGLLIVQLFSSILIAFASGAQFLAIMLPIDMFKQKAQELDVRPEHLSRVVESGGTVSIALVPWGVFAVFISGVFEFSAYSFIPFILFAVFTPIVTLIRLIFSKNSSLIIKEDTNDSLEKSKLHNLEIKN